ncbi:ATP-binding protein [bacterium]|nr:ATP-binding protein [bacterium]
MASDPNIAIEAGDTLDNLVQQFSDQFAFLRELVQNSIDAGSGRVDIDFEYTPNKDNDKGVFVLHINDTGEGMTREVIDTKLTRLFSSSKEDDFTKIGKFGIGFVSIFALKPKAVFVDTGKDGEYWRIYFKEDRTFDRLVLPRPVEGTQIKWIKELTPKENLDYRAESRRTLMLWCKHAESEVYVDGELLNQPFDLNHPLAVTHEVQGTYVSAAPTHDERPFFGFYNRGLTLAEGHESIVPGVEFKIRSRYLEHTLTRDNVIKDKNYDKAMVILREAVDKKLRPALFAAAQAQTNDDVLGYLAYHLGKVPPELEQEPIIPTLGQRKASIRELRREIKQFKEVLYEEETNPVVQHLIEDGRLVIRWKGESERGLGAMLRILADKVPVIPANSVYASPVLLKELPDIHEKMIQAAMRILHRAGSAYRKVVPANFMYANSSVSEKIYLPCDKATDLIRHDKKTNKFGIFSRLFSLWNKDTTVLLNVGHPLIEPHFRLKPEFRIEGPYLLASAIVSDDGISPEQSTKLLEAYLEEEDSGD